LQYTKEDITKNILNILLKLHYSSICSGCMKNPLGKAKTSKLVEEPAGSHNKYPIL